MYTDKHLHFITLLLLLAALSLAAGCSATPKGEAKYPTGADRSGAVDDIYAKPKSIFGEESMLSLGTKGDADDGSSVIGVNTYLWRASLDTVSFMPLASADPFGGVIITDWYAAAETPDERIKMNIFILDRQLRSDGIQVKVFKQQKSGSTWRDVALSDEVGRKIEDQILTRARQLRFAAANR